MIGYIEMIPEYEKYRAEIFKIAGFAMLTPIGRLFLQPGETFAQYGAIGTLIYVIVSLVLAYFGLYTMLKAYVEMEKIERRKWMEEAKAILFTLAIPLVGLAGMLYILYTKFNLGRDTKEDKDKKEKTA